jgi:prepilin-type N-terminal cleavage/methylation domain-containing protein
MMRCQRAFTLIELMVVVAVLAIIATLAAPSFRDFIVLQRLKGINAQVVTDLQFARSEAVARNTLMRVRFRANDSLTCYSIFTSPANNERCDCLLGVGAVSCDADATEVRTVQVPKTLSVLVLTPPSELGSFAYDPVTGGIKSIPLDSPGVPINQFVVDTSIDSSRSLRIVLNRAGRPSVCKPAGSTMSVEVCP